MEWTYKKEKNGGQWILILGCPLKKRPYFGDCVRCEHQIGMNLYILDENDDIIECYPERLRCGLLEKEGDEQGWLNEDKGYLSGKEVAILGAGSLLGRSLAREAAGYEPKRLILIGHDENGLAKTQNELIADYPYLSHKLVLTDLADKNSMERVFHRYRPQILFHAGTWRHLHFTERQPLDAVRANFLTVRWLAEMADKTGMERFIFLSTLKAAYPRSYFSVIHKMAELYLHEIATRSKTRSISVRVGNILGEETHFVKVLRREILEKGTATLPIPDKGFWFLSADKAAQLVIKAGGMGDGGEVFSLDRGRRITMRGIAEELQKGAKGAESFSLFPGTGAVRDIEFIPDASKWDPWLIEELSMEEGPCPEKERPTAFSDIQIVETKSYGWDRLRGELDEIEALVEKGNEKGLKERLRVYFPLAIPAQGE